MEFRLRGVEGVVEPAAEVVVAGAGVWLAEEVGDLGSDLGVMEEGECRRLGGGERRRDVGDDGGEGFDGGVCLGVGIRP